MSPTLAQGIDSGLDYVGRRVEVRFANFQMNYFLALTLQGTRLVENFKGGLGAETRHALSQSKLVLCGFSHRGKPGIIQCEIDVGASVRLVLQRHGSRALLDLSPPAARAGRSRPHR